MEQSILKSTKKILGVGDDDPSFDLDIITNINSAFSDLNDIGLGPTGGFVIVDDTATWADFLPDADKVQQSRVKTCVFFKTRLAFVPPATTYHLNSLQELIRENMWRLNTVREATAWTDPDPTPVLDPDAGTLGFDGGGAE